MTAICQFSIPGKSKHRAKKATCRAGHGHDSRSEAKRCDELHLLEKAGEISHLQVFPRFYFVVNGVQVKHDNGRRVSYEADFSYFENSAAVVEDVKGRSRKADSRDWPLRRAFFRVCFPGIELREVRG